MKKRHKALLAIVVILAGIPLMLWLSWLLSTPQPVSVFVMDKSSYTPQSINNRSIHWVLNHYRFTRPDGKIYNAGLDYFGFFPLDNTNYEIRDLTGLSPVEIQQMARKHEIAYYADSYGVYSDTWPLSKRDTAAVRKLYGGLDWEDLLFLEYMLELKHLVVAEFIFMAPPTQASLRKKAEDLMGIEWKSWTGRYFHTLDTADPECVVPSWIPVIYEVQYGQPWGFRKSGVVLVSENETLVVLEEATHLGRGALKIVSDAMNQKRYGMGSEVNYSGWFDITFPTSSDARVISWYQLDVTAEGAAILNQFDLPSRFPAVIHNEGDKKMLYLAGDFGHSPIKPRFVKFKGARFAELFLADLNDPTDKSAFFLVYYLPVMRKILSDFHKDLTKN
jgi:hypothetical protein